ncbi:family 16 glycoside hydrolase [Rufibacter aurantiacus]|uniref:family 16 glycoside hydrolase n=1 Tax=Rufibacter aurantiacus TaxID=2817374 RepID=UPI001B30BA47|nr:family 16 glycoside hydrolase [Rufibacter aurantiacus]
MKKQCAFLALWLCSLPALTAPKKDFTSSDWQLPSGNAGMTHFNGQESLYIQKGMALLGEEQLQNGVLEVDIADDDARGFAGLVFHHDGEGTYEEIYVRLHKAGQPDALQYAPVYHQSNSWALYPEHQATATFASGEWTHLKVVIQGSTAAVYLNHADQPSLTVSDLKIKNQPKTRIGLKALDGAYFSNFRFSPLPQVSAPLETKTPDAPAAIMHWQVSQALAIPQHHPSLFVLPDRKALTWENLPTEASGLLNIAAHRQKTSAEPMTETPESYVWVKLDLNSDRPQLRQFFFEYSNKAQVFLNGQPLFYGDNSFRAKGLLFRGDIDKTLQTNSLFLPLRQGNNTLLIALSSEANGWGLMGRLDRMAGIKLINP